LQLGQEATTAVLSGGLLAVSQEPRGGSPTGLPTGPVVFTGPLLPAPD
jgi:anti-sigma-K factor RskA